MFLVIFLILIIVIILINLIILNLELGTDIHADFVMQRYILEIKSISQNLMLFGNMFDSTQSFLEPEVNFEV